MVITGIGRCHCRNLNPQLNFMQRLRRLNPCWFTILITCSFFSLPAFAAKNSNADYIAYLWGSYHVDYLLDNMKASLYSGENDLIGSLEKANADKIKAIVDQNYVDINAHMKTYMAKQGRSTLLVKSIQWFKTPLGEKLTKLNTIPNSLFVDPEAPIPTKEPEVSRERLQLKKKFEGLMFGPANGFIIGTHEHFMTLQNHTKQPNNRLQPKQLEEQIQLATVKLRNITSQILPFAYYRNYNDLSLEEVTVLLNYLDSDAGRGFTDLLVEAYLDAIKVTEPTALLSLSKMFENELSVLSPYSKAKLSDAQQRELMALLIKEHGKPVVIRAMLEARNGEMTIFYKGEEKEVVGRPNQEYVTLDTLMRDLARSGKDMRDFYKIVQKYSNK